MRTTLAVLTYNHERFVDQAIAGALGQRGDPIEILISDDCSTDRTWQCIEGAVANYHGPHTVTLNRNRTNLGVGAHTDSVLRRATGEIVILAAGDDISFPSRAERVGDAFADPAVNCVTHPLITPRGIESPIPPGWNDVTRATLGGMAIWGAALAFRRSALISFSPIPQELRSCEDIVLPFRAVQGGRIVCLDEALVEYREHLASLMGETRDARSYAVALKRMVASTYCARRIQMSDLAESGELGKIPLTVMAEMALPIVAHMEREEPLRRILFRQPGGITAAVKAMLTRRITPVEAIKAVAMGLAPAQWGRYQAWRGGHG